MPTLPHGQDRTRLVVGDPDGRDTATVWAVGGGLRTDAYTWTDPAGTQYPAPRVHLPRTSGNGWPLQFYGSAKLPPNATPGRWTLDCGRGPEFAFDVVAAPAPDPNPTALKPGDGPGKLAAALAHGDVTLAPGLYEWDESCLLPDCTGRRVVGVGAVIRSTAPVIFDRDRGGNAVVQDVTFDGLTVEGNRTNDCFRWLPGLGCRGCTFRAVNLGAEFAPVTLTDCRFDRAGCTLAPPGLYLRCEWTGPGTPHAFDYWYGSGSLALIDCVFRNTDRGPTVNTGRCPVSDNLFVGTRLYDLAGEENGSESFLAEGADEFSRNLILTTRALNCRGPVVCWLTAANGNLVWDLQADAPAVLSGACAGNQFFDSEWRDAYLEFGPLATNNAVNNSGLSLLAPHRWNQNGYAVWMYDQPCRSVAARVTDPSDATGAVIDTPQSRTNVLTGCRITTGPGLTAAAGVGLAGCRVNGAAVPAVQ